MEYNTIMCRYNVVQHNAIFRTTLDVTEVLYKSEYVFTKDTPYLALRGELWGVFWGDFQEHWLHHNDTTLYLIKYKQRFLTPGHQGWNDLHSLCRIGMEYYLLNNDDNNIIYWIMMIIMIMMMMIIIMIIMMTMMIIGTATIMIMIIIITTTLTMTIMKMIMIKTAQTPCQSLYKDRHI